MLLAKQSTALTLVVGPILDSTGAEYASAVIGDLSISKNGGTLTALASAASLTVIANGQYILVLTTGNTDTLGAFQITCNKSTYQMPMIERQVVPATVYDAIVTNATNTNGGLLAASTATTVNANVGTTQPTNFTGTAGSALVKTDMVGVAGAAVSASSAQIGVNAVNIGGTAQTGRDIGASVLLSTGTGTGQLDFTNGVVKANLAQILGTALTETAGQIAAAFKKFFNIATPAATMDHLVLVDTVTTLTGNTPQTGDVYPLVDTEIAAIKAKTDNLPSSPAAVGSAMTLTNAYDFAKGTVAMAESYNADGAAPTPVQSLFVLMQMLTEMSAAGTVVTVKKLDGTTTAFTLNTNDATTPTSITRAT